MPEPLAEFEARIEAHLGSLSLPSNFPPNLLDAVRYAALGGGKRLRPLLCWRCAEAVGAGGHASLDAGAAVELVHCFSLVHDDLPALDNDDLRRGRPSLHRYAGEAAAILAGDALLTLGLHVLHRRAGDAEVGRLLARELSSAVLAMIAGQVRDLLPDGAFPDDMPDARRVELLHAEKTGALIRAACRMGAICGLAELTQAPGRTLMADPRMAAVDRYAAAVGLMFQIMDDLLDEEQTAEHAGKRTGKDRAAGKLTFPRVHGIPAARERVAALEREAVAAAEELPHGTPLRDIAAQLARRTR